MWNPRISRWLILRRPRPNSLPAPVKTWCARDGSFLPLDRRILVWLRQNDVQRKFSGRREKFFGQFVERELNDHQSDLDRERAKAEKEKWDEAHDKMKFACKQLESRGLLRKIGGMH